MVCKRMGGELLQFRGEEDHVHLLVSLSSKTVLCHFVGQLKGASSYAIRNSIFGEVIQSKLWGKSLWSPSYCAVSCGCASLDVIKEYEKNQRIPSIKRGKGLPLS